jgi:hypothetical protein
MNIPPRPAPVPAPMGEPSGLAPALSWFIGQLPNSRSFDGESSSLLRALKLSLGLS